MNACAGTKNVNAINHPMVVVRSLVRGPLVRIGTEIFDQGHTERD